MKKALAISLILVAALVSGQSQNTTVRDTSKDGSPVSVRGTLSFSNSGALANVTAHNLSTKAILAIVATLDATAPDGFPVSSLIEHEYFFKETSIGPDSDFDLTNGHLDFPSVRSEYAVGPDGIKKPIVYDSTGSPHAEAQIVFVQFDDGSMWGDSNAGKAMIAERPSVKQFLQRLLSAYDQSGDSGIIAVLAEEPPYGTSLRAIRSVLRQTKEQSGTDILVERIKQKIAAAEVRQAKLNP